MNKFKTLVNISICSWVIAIILMLFTWFRIWTLVFATTNYRIEDTFIYIGVLGGWLFVCVFYVALIILAGYFIIGIIKKLDVLASGEEQ